MEEMADTIILFDRKNNSKRPKFMTFYFGFYGKVCNMEVKILSQERNKIIHILNLVIFKSFFVDTNYIILKVNL